jgi:hypothetical protein
MGHNRSIVLSGVSLTPARLNREIFKVTSKVMDEIELLMQGSGYLDHAPFRWVGLIFHYGLKNEDEPHYQPIDPKDGELPLAIELDTHELRTASPEELHLKLSLGALRALIHAGRKYGLLTAGLEVRYAQLVAS